MQYVLLAIVLVVSFAVLRTFVVAGARASAGVRLSRRCQGKYEELIRKGLEPREALVRVCREEYPHLSVKVHEQIVDKCQDLWRLASFLSVVLANARPRTWRGTGPLVDDEAEALLEATSIAESGRVSTDYGVAERLLRHKQTSGNCQAITGGRSNAIDTTRRTKLARLWKPLPPLLALVLYSSCLLGPVGLVLAYLPGFLMDSAHSSTERLIAASVGILALVVWWVTFLRPLLPDLLHLWGEWIRRGTWR
jgi:hypothetical protein